MTCPPLRQLEVLAALSLALDLGSGQPSGHALTAAVVADRIGRSLGLDGPDRREAMVLALLRFIGCTTESHRATEVFGDEIAAASFLVGSDYGDPVAVMRELVSHLREDWAPIPRANAVLRAITKMPGLMDLTLAHCEVGVMLLGRLGIPAGTQERYRQMFERWDGRGDPAALRGEAISRGVHIAIAAGEAAALFRRGGSQAVRAAARKRGGGAWSPEVAGLLSAADSALLDVDGPWEEVLRREPEPWVHLDERGIDSALSAMADFADMKSLAHAGHSRAVATLAADAAALAGLDDDDIIGVRRAGLVHDLGCSGISASLWNKAGPLSDSQWESVRLHPYHTERCLSRAPLLAPIGRLASLHHERMGGTGYHHGLRGGALPLGARILAVADTLVALRAPRAWRPALAEEPAVAILREEVRAGRLDGKAVDAVLAATGRPRTTGPARLSLTDREVQVLRLLAVGRTTREIAEQLGISPKTADHHIQHVYVKLGVSTRAGAACFAMELGLMDPFAGE